MNGLTLSEKYYYEVGLPMLKTCFPEYLPRITAGLMGDGSDCLGFDDSISQDHDFGPGFCLWLESADFQIIGKQMQQEYDRLPSSFQGFLSRNTTVYGADRVGVIEVQDFFCRYIGSEQPPESLLRWLTLPEEKLASVTAGKIFTDSNGTFHQILSALHYYPEDVRKKKIAAASMRMAQSGQYNYARCMQRGDTVAARFALDEFIRNTISIQHLLNRRYMPYYKWMYQSMKSLPLLSALVPLIQELSDTVLQKNFWNNVLSLPLECRSIQIIEKICRLVIDELKVQELVTEKGNDLIRYPQEIADKIVSSELKQLPVLFG